MLPITKLLHSAMENKEKNLEYSDTKFRNGQKYKREFVEAVVFVVGTDFDHEPGEASRT